MPFHEYAYLIMNVAKKKVITVWIDNMMRYVRYFRRLHLILYPVRCRYELNALAELGFTVFAI